ncbi:MAG: FkbM family methyltransferase [Selenomonadaceae bacterium]|nr:FkbM family methyltransferase [Selenomonadaceae bacterium]
MKVGARIRDFQIDFEVIPEYFRTLVETLQIKRVKDYRLARAGDDHDGGYILIDNLDSQGGIAYSFGIEREISWDHDMAECGYQIFMYDMTIDDLPYHRPEFHFFQEGIGRELDLSQRLDTLENFIERNGHQNQRNMILKMDVEGAEWDFLETVKSETLMKFDQIIFEFHNLVTDMDFERIGRRIAALRKLNQTHQVVHIHANNNCPAVIYEDDFYGDVIEVTYANRANYEFEDAEIILPNPTVDAPNIPEYPEIELGNWNARFKNS